MKLLLDIKDKKAPFVMELLKSLSFVKVKVITPTKDKVKKEVKKALDETKPVKPGKKKTKKGKKVVKEK